MAASTPASQSAEVLLEPERLRLHYAYAATLTHAALADMADLHGDLALGDQQAIFARLETAQQWVVATLTRAGQALDGLRDSRVSPTQAAPSLKDEISAARRSEVAPDVGTPKTGSKAVDRARRFLEETFIPTTSVLQAGIRLQLLKFDSDLKGARELPSSVKQWESVTNYRVRYNLACFWSSYAESPYGPQSVEQWLDSAISHLATALSGAGPDARRLARWARKDPSLAYLRDHPRQGGRFASLLRSVEPAESEISADLAALAAIGPVAAARLQDVGIKTPADVGDDTSSSILVARELELSVELVDRWLHAARLLSLTEITADIVNLLHRAGINSLGELARWDGVPLRSRLQGLADEGETPTLSKLDHWVAEARRRTRERF